MEILSKVLIVPFRHLKENTDNPRFIRNDKFNKLVSSVCEFPQMLYKRPLIVVTDSDDLYKVLGGNMRLKAIPAAIRKLKKLVIEDEVNADAWRERLQLLEKGVPVTLADEWSEEQRQEFVVKDNVSYGEHDWELLANQFDKTQLIDWGMDVPDVDVIPADADEDDFDMVFPVEPITQSGDVYVLNGHKLICGDCRSMGTVLSIFGSEDDKKANLSFTSPPYWVGKDYETEKSEAEIDKFIEDVGRCIVAATEPTHGRIVINTGTSSINRIDRKRKVEILPLIDKWGKVFRKDNWLMRHMRIWVKRGQLPASISPKTDVIDQHNEFIATFEKEWSQVLTFWNPDGDQRGQERLGTPWAQQGVWDDVHGEMSANGRHIAAFPVAIPFRNILLYTKKGEIVFDCFGGSGTSIIACEQLDRICRLVEIDPGYCDVIVTRWISYMQQYNKPYTVTRNGQPFNLPNETASKN